MLQSDIWVADLVQALNALAPADDVSADAIAALLGVQAFPEADAKAGRPASLGSDLDGSPAPQADTVDVDEAPVGMREVHLDGSPESPNAAEDIRTVLRAASTEPPPVPANRWVTIPALERGDPGSLPREPPHEPLLDPRWQRDMAIAAAAQLLPLGGVDVRALVDRAARGVPIARVPRRRRWSVNLGVQLLIDGGIGMEPFRRDQALFADVLRTVVGSERVDILDFEDAPLQGVFDRVSGVRRDYRTPTAGTPVIVLSDLGRGGPRHTGPRSGSREWQQFANAVRRVSRLVSFVPFPPELLPPSLRRAAGAVYWDRSAGHRQVREVLAQVAERSPASGTRRPALSRRTAADRDRRASELAALVSPAVFVEPELLRAMRLTMLPRSGPEIESAVWFAPAVRARNASGIVFHDGGASRLRAALRDAWRTDPALRPRLTLARAVMDRIHAGQSAALRLEERLAWCVVTGDIGGAEQELERALKAHADGGRPGIAKWAGQAWKRLPAEARGTRSGWLFHQLARSAAKGQDLGTIDTPPDLRPEDIAAALALVPDVKFGVRRHGETLELGNLAGEAAVAIMVPDTQPRTLDVLINEDEARPVTVHSYERATIDVGPGAVALRTMRGHIYVVPPVPGAAPKSQAPSARSRAPAPTQSWAHTWPAWELHFDKDGKVPTEALPDLGASAGLTDVFVLVHGFNTDRVDARAFYSRLLTEPSTRIPGGAFRERRLGALAVFWPSKLWADTDDEPGDSGIGPDSKAAESQLAQIERSMDSEQRQRLADASQRLAAHPDDKDARDQVDALTREVTASAAGEAGSGGDRDAASGGGLFGGLWGSVKNLGRITSYWAMRTRARTIGRSGLGPALGRILDDAPGVRMHIVAHSLGARLACYAVQDLRPGGSDSRRVKSLVLLQPVLAKHAFAASLPANPRQAGMLASVPGSVDGPIVVTFSTADSAARLAYESSARIVGGDDDTPGERPAKAMAFEGAQGLSAITTRLGPVGTIYTFYAGRVVNVDASALIKAHGDVTGPELAWLILAAADAATQNSPRAS